MRSTRRHAKHAIRLDLQSLSIRVAGLSTTYATQSKTSRTRCEISSRLLASGLPISGPQLNCVSAGWKPALLGRRFGGTRGFSIIEKKEVILRIAQSQPRDQIHAFDFGYFLVRNAGFELLNRTHYVFSNQCLFVPLLDVALLSG